MAGRAQVVQVSTKTRRIPVLYAGRGTRAPTHAQTLIRKHSSVKNCCFESYQPPVPWDYNYKCLV